MAAKPTFELPVVDGLATAKGLSDEVNRVIWQIWVEAVLANLDSAEQEAVFDEIRGILPAVEAARDATIAAADLSFDNLAVFKAWLLLNGPQGDGKSYFVKDRAYSYVESSLATFGFVNVGPVKIVPQPILGALEPAMFFPPADGVTDAIEALEAFRDAVEVREIIGRFDNSKYAVSRTLRLTSLGGYTGLESVEIIATSDFDIDYTDPVADALADNLAPVVFFDGRVAAVGDPTRVPIFDMMKIDGNGVAPHGLMCVGILPMNSRHVRVDRTTKDRIVLCGVQNATLIDWKSQSSSQGGTPCNSDTYAVSFLNGTKNCTFISYDITGATATAEGMVRVGNDPNYPPAEPGIADVPSLMTFVGGVWENIGESEDPKRALHITGTGAGDVTLLHFINTNLAMKPSVAMVEAEAGMTGVHFSGGRWNGKEGAAPPVISEARSFVMDRVFLSLFGKSGETTLPHLFEINGNGRFEFIECDNGLFGSWENLFGGTHAHHAIKHVPARYFGDDAAKSASHATSATGTRWWNADLGVESIYIDGSDLVASTGLPIPVGTEDVNSWPTLTDADVSAGVLDVSGYPKVKLNLTAPTTITGISANSLGQSLMIAPMNSNATFQSGVGLKTAGRVDSTPPAGRILSFERVNSTGATEWVQRSGPEGRVAATSAQLGDATNSINTTDKYPGKVVLNSTTNHLVQAAGSGATSNWLGGGASITPA